MHGELGESGEKACNGRTVCTDNGGAACGLQGLPSRFLCTGTGLDAVHRTGAGDQHTVAGVRDEWIEEVFRVEYFEERGWGLAFGGSSLSGLRAPGLDGLGLGGLGAWGL